jgi:hypothetical protein
LSWFGSTSGSCRTRDCCLGLVAQVVRVGHGSIVNIHLRMFKSTMNFIFYNVYM